MNSDPLALSTTGQNATQISWILKRLVGMWDIHGTRPVQICVREPRSLQVDQDLLAYPRVYNRLVSNF